MQRRNFIKAAGGVGMVTVGGVALSGSAAADSSITIQADDPSKVTSDDGTLSLVTIAPQIDLSWSGFDETVSRARVLIEARVDGGAYQPVFRSTPWFDDTEHEGTSASGVTLNSEVFGVRGIDAEYDEQDPAPIEIANATGVPDYEAVADSAGQTEQSYLEGTSIGTPTETAGIVNHSDDGDGHKYGYYGAAAPIDAFYATEDGTTDETTVDLRYTATLHTDDQYTPLAMYDAYEGEIAESEAPSGMDVDADSIPHSVLAASDGHPAVIVTETSFDVTVENEPADGGADGSTNADAE